MSNVAYVSMFIQYAGVSSSYLGIEWYAVAVDQSTGMTLGIPGDDEDWRLDSSSQIPLTAGDVISGEVIKNQVAADVRSGYEDPDLIIIFLSGGAP